MVNAGDHWDRNISRHMLPLLFMFGWYILVVKASCIRTQYTVNVADKTGTGISPLTCNN